MHPSCVKEADSIAIRQASELLKAGQLVAFPTETVYGLGADATNPQGIERLYRAKGRPSNHPVILHLGSFDQLPEWCIDIPKAAETLAKAFWPGPLTMVFKRSAKALDAITGGQDTVAIRIPNHPVALALLKEFGGGLIAPSANRFGKVSPTRAEHVSRQFADQISLILDGGACEVGIESTIVNLTSRNIEILRPGMISSAQIAECLGIDEPSSLERSTTTVRVSGDLPSHYAPQAPVRLLSMSEIKAKLTAPLSAKNAYAVIAFQPQDAGANGTIIVKWIEASLDPSTYAKSLYASLQEIDLSNANEILIEKAPNGVAWQGINDRLQRAAADK
jgi:L-threonylcarbamoyladenylate synthase